MAERLAASRLAAAQADAGLASDDDRAPLTTRILAYAIDSFLLFFFVALFATIAGLSMLLRTNSGEEGLTETDQWFFVFLILAAMPAWLIVNLLVISRRGQTVGQYVLGLRILREDGGEPSFLQLLAYWMALHPLFFHPLFGGCWGLAAAMTFAEVTEYFAVVPLMSGALICFAGPIAGLIFALIDPQRRAIHDRLAGLKVVRVD